MAYDKKSQEKKRRRNGERRSATDRLKRESDSVSSVEPQSPNCQSEALAGSLIVRQKNPDNLETPFNQVGSFLTPAELFYIRSHFPVPKLDSDSYRLWIDGAVRKPFSLSYAELRKLPGETRVATLECAGNGRIFLIPQARGVQWELGAVGNAEWTGVSLAALLKRAGLAEDACEIVFEGADRGMLTGEAAPAGPISYARSLPKDKALRPEVLIAYQMNGRTLSPEHGYPVRAIVPGHYAMASVKWLTHIHVVQKPFLGYWQTADYGYWDGLDGKPVRCALGEMQVKSEISRPHIHETIEPNRDYTIFGAAWAGETEVTRVAVSSDGGQTWAEADFLDPIRRHAWRRWQFKWRTPSKPGRYTLLARASGADRSVQPDKHNQKYGSYVINHTLPIEILVAPNSPPPRRLEKR